MNMAWPIRFGTLLCIVSAMFGADRWPGALVDVKCYSALERNVNPTDTETAVDRDRSSEIRYCAPTSRTKSFGVVQQDATSLDFDAIGNTRAAELVRKIGKKSWLLVTVAGKLSGHVIKVDSISAAETGNNR